MKFSNGGQYFAVAFGRKISIFETYKQLPNPIALHTFSYHTAQITAIEWSPTDDHFYTSAIEEIYMWNIKNGSRNDDFIIQGSSLGNILDFSVSNVNDNDRHYCAVVLLDDGTVSMTTCAGGKTDSIRLGNSENACCVCIDHHSQLLLAGMDNGSIYVYNWPIKNDAEIICKLNLYSTQTTVGCICMAPNGELISCGDDAAIFVSSIVGRNHDESRSQWSSPMPGYGNVVLLSSEEHQSQRQQINELKKSVESIKRDTAFTNRCKVRNLFVFIVFRSL